MDNLETGGESNPQEAADVTAASGQFDEQIETQTPEETTEPVDGGTEEGAGSVADTHPWDQDERFKGKSPEEMFEIVREADKYKGQLSQKAKVADMLSQQFGLTPERMAEIASKRAQDARQKQIAQNPLAAVYDKVQQLETEIKVKEEDSQLDSFLSENPQFQDFREEIRTLGYSVDRDKSWEQIADKYFGRAIVMGQENAYKQFDVKQKTQATGVSQGDVKPSVTLEDMQKMTAAELEAILPKAYSSQ